MQLLKLSHVTLTHSGYVCGGYALYSMVVLSLPLQSLVPRIFNINHVLSAICVVYAAVMGDFFGPLAVCSADIAV